jgi:hypothetical protein
MRKRLVRVLVVLALVAASIPLDAPGMARAPASAAPMKSGLKGRRKMRALLRKKGLAKLPSVAEALAGPATAAGLAPAAVVGTPPTLLAIPDLSAANVFWAPGVVDAIVAGNVSPGACAEFWGGTQDGQSGGMNACRVAQTVGYSFGDILSGETSLCYMKNLPTSDNVDAGAVTLVSGSFPGDNPSRLFSVPGGDGSRVVQVHVTGEPEGAQSVFIRVYGSATNAAAGNLYAADLWFCPVGQTTPRGFNRIRIGTDGRYSVEDDGTEMVGSHADVVAGFVSFVDGAIAYDTTRPRRAVGAFSGDGGSSKTDHEIDPDDTIASKALNVYGGNVDASYVVSSFSGTDADSLRFLAGAFKGANGIGPGYVGSTEFRSTFYAASPGAALESRLSAVDLATDEFYAAPASVTVDTSEFSCDATADVELALHFENPAAAAVKRTCEHRLWERMRFCDDDPAVQAASMACAGPR